MKRMFLTSALSALVLIGSNAFACVGPACGPYDSFSGSSYAIGDANQWLNGDGFSFGEPNYGTTWQSGNLAQEAWGATYNGSIDLQQFGTQAHEYGYAIDSPNGYTGHQSFNAETAGMYGRAFLYGNFDAYSNVGYGSSISTDNFGIQVMGSTMSDGFGLSLGGSAYGLSEVNNYVDLQAGNAFEQYATNGEDYVFQAGASSVNAWGNGEAFLCGNFGASVYGGQNLGIVTFMDGNGTSMSGSIGGSSNLQSYGYESGLANVNVGAIAEQQGTYTQYNTGPNGYQYSTGSINTTAFVGNNSVF